MRFNLNWSQVNSMAACETVLIEWHHVNVSINDGSYLTRQIPRLNWKEVNYIFQFNLNYKRIFALYFICVKILSLIYTTFS